MFGSLESWITKVDPEDTEPDPWEQQAQKEASTQNQPRKKEVGTNPGFNFQSSWIIAQPHFSWDSGQQALIIMYWQKSFSLLLQQARFI